jgi:hypothetical protein
VTGWPVVFLGVMAVALVAMAMAQLLIGLAVLRATRKISDATQQLQQEVRPLIDNATKLTQDAARVAALAAVQAERVDQLLASVTIQINETMGVVRSAIEGPARQGAAIIAGFRAVMAAIREWQGQPSRATDDEDAMFVG